MILQRLTKKREEILINVDTKHGSEQDIFALALNVFLRLQLIEDVLGDKYDIDRLKKMVEKYKINEFEETKNSGEKNEN